MSLSNSEISPYFSPTHMQTNEHLKQRKQLKPAIVDL